jgi:hypothetical protein
LAPGLSLLLFLLTAALGDGADQVDQRPS